VRATLFALPASHPSLAAQLMLEHKGIEYRRIDLVAATQRVMLPALGFPRKTVPAIRLDGAKIQYLPRAASTAPPTRLPSATSLPCPV
jgi:glutathione S-transferase